MSGFELLTSMVTGMSCITWIAEVQRCHTKHSTVGPILAFFSGNIYQGLLCASTELLTEDAAVFIHSYDNFHVSLEFQIALL